MKRDLIYGIVIAILLVLVIINSGIIPVKTFPTALKPHIVKPKYITLYRTIKKPITNIITRTKYLAINITHTVTSYRTFTLIKTFTFTHTEVLVKTVTLTKSIERTVTVIRYPRELLRKSANAFVMPGDEFIVSMRSDSGLSLVNRAVKLFISFSKYDINFGNITCYSLHCSLNSSSLDYLGSCLKARMLADSSEFQINLKHGVNVSNATLYLFMYIPESERYTTNIDLRTYRAMLINPTINSPIMTFQLTYLSDNSEVIAKPLEFKRMGFNWYVLEFNVRGLNISTFKLSMRRYVLFINYVMLDKIILLPNKKFRLYLEQPVVTLLNVSEKEVRCPGNMSVCSYSIPITWFIVVKDLRNETLFVGNTTYTYTVIVNSNGNLLSITPPTEATYIELYLDPIKYLRTIPGNISLTIVIGLKSTTTHK